MIQIKVYYGKCWGYSYSYEEKYRSKIYGQKKEYRLKFVLRAVDYIGGVSQRFDLRAVNDIKWYAYCMGYISKIGFRS